MNFLRFFNMFLALLPIGVFFNPFLILGLDTEELARGTFAFWDYSKVVFGAFIVSEGALFVYRKSQKDNTFKFLRYFICLPIIAVGCSANFVGWYYFYWAPMYALGFVFSPIAWVTYLIIGFFCPVFWKPKDVQK
jgi:hypothetical protein